MKHPGPTIPAEGQDEKGAVTQVLNDYIRVFGSFDAQRVLPYYHEPLMFLGGARIQGVAVLSTHTRRYRGVPVEAALRAAEGRRLGCPKCMG